MTFPVVAASAATNASADQTTHVINLPSGIAAGDLLAVWFTKDATGGTVSTPSGWTLSGSASATDTAHLFTRTASGSEGATVTITTSLSESSSAVALRITGWTSFSADVNFQATTSVFGCGNAITPTPTVTTKSLAVAFLGVPGNITTPTQQTDVGGTLAATASLATETACRATWAPTVAISTAPELFLPSQVQNPSAYRWGHLLVYGDAISSARAWHPLQTPHVIG